MPEQPSDRTEPVPPTRAAPAPEEGVPSTVDGVTTGDAPPYRSLLPPAPFPRTSRVLPAPGECLGDFELLAVLGSGSFACVYLARQISLGRQVALKVSANLGPHPVAP